MTITKQKKTVVKNAVKANDDFLDPRISYMREWEDQFSSIDNAENWLDQLKAHWAAGSFFGTDEENKIIDARFPTLDPEDKPKVHLALLLGELQNKMGATKLSSLNLKGLELKFSEPRSGHTYYEDTDETEDWNCAGCIWFVGTVFTKRGVALKKFQITFFRQAYYHPRSYVQD